MDKIHNNLLKIDQKIMNIWYRKTVVNQFQTNNKILKKLSNNNNFCEHILSSLENNMNTLLKKTQKYNNSDNNNQLLGRKDFQQKNMNMIRKYIMIRIFIIFY